MSERGAAAAAAPPAGMLVLEQKIAEALDSLLRHTNPFASLNGVVQQLESKLGVELGHKIDFIRSQIHNFILLQSQPQSSIIYPHQQQNNRFPAFYEAPTFHFAPSPHLPSSFTAHHPSQSYGFYRPPQPQLSQTPTSPPAMVKNPSGVASKESCSAHTEKKRKCGPGGLNKLCGVSPELQTIVGQPKMGRTEIVKQLWAYIKKNNLQDPSNKRKIICNEDLRLVFETDCTDMFKMNKLLTKHILPLEPTKQTAQNAKKPKVDVESEDKSDDPVPIVSISEALASFFGTDEREMSQAEVLRQMWEYIKVNQLENEVYSDSLH